MRRRVNRYTAENSHIFEARQEWHRTATHGPGAASDEAATTSVSAIPFLAGAPKPPTQKDVRGGAPEGPGQPQQNACIARYNRTVRCDWLALHLFESLDEIQDFATGWLWTYNHERPNMGLDGITLKQSLLRSLPFIGTNLFDRFHRAGQAHQRHVPGVGPGLSLARDIAAALGGALELAPAAPGQVCFRPTPPAA